MQKQRPCLLFSQIRCIAALVLAMSIAACAKVEVRSVSNPQSAEGVRFYLPRPYVAVHEPFVVAAEAYVVGGQLSANSQYVLITDWQDNDTLGNILKMAQGRAIPAATVLVAPMGATGEAQGAEEHTPETPSANLPTGEGPLSSPTGGHQTTSTTNDNAAYAVTPLRRYMDIVWLPDFDEQYSITGRGGLGNSSIDVRMGQGWSLQGLDVNVDNSAVVDPLLNFYSQTVKGLSKVVQTKLGIMPVAESSGTPQGAIESETAASFAGGTPVSIKVTVVRMATPGLYPVLKEKEFSAVDNLEDIPDYVLVPVPPLTRIAFNTYEVVVIEAATVAEDSPLRMHQYPSQWGQSITGYTDTPLVSNQNPIASIKAIETTINQGFGGDDENRWQVTLTWSSETRSVHAALSKTGIPPESQDAAVESVRQLVSNQAGYALSGNRVAITDQ